MGKISIIKEFSWDMAHMLSDHLGLCGNLHGHTYRMQVEVSNRDGLIKDPPPVAGMIIDFSELEDIIRLKIIDPLDHAFIYWRNSNDPVEHQIADLLKSSGKKLMTISYRPTVEEMTLDIFTRLTSELESMGLIVERIRVWETATSYAEALR